MTISSVREQSLESLDLGALSVLKKTEAAMTEGYFHYAHALALTLVNRYPNVPGLRLLLRQAVVGQKAAATPAVFVYLRASFSTVVYAFSGRLFNYLNSLEKILCSSPDSRLVHKLFASAAQKGELWQTAALSYESLLVWFPMESHFAIQLAQCYLKLGRIDEAQCLIRKALELSPKNTFAEELLKQASVAETLNHTDWKG